MPPLSVDRLRITACVCLCLHFSVHLKIHIPKIIKKHTHVQTIYKHMLQKVPVLDESEGEYTEGSERYVRIDPKITLSALRATNNLGGGGGVTGNELRSLKWVPRYHRKELEGSYSNPPLPLKGLKKRYPKNVQVVHEYEEYNPHPRTKKHRIVKHMIPTYEIQEDSDEDYDPASREEYAETRPKKSYLKASSTKTLKFLPASEVSQYIPTIPFSSLTGAQSQFQPMWTPLSDAAARKPSKEHLRSGRSSRYEGTTTRVFSTQGVGADSYSAPLLPHGTHLERRFQMHFL